MLLGLALLLATASVAIFPRWRYSRRWGYAPCAIAAVLLVTVAAVAASGRTIDKADIRISRAQAGPAAPLHNQTIDNARERLMWSSEPSIAAVSAYTRFD